MDQETLEKVNIILRQTNYDHQIALEKLQHANGDHIQVIKQYMGIAEKKAPEIKSVNQEIYRQLRYKMDSSIRDYNKQQQEKLTQEIANNNN